MLFSRLKQASTTRRLRALYPLSFFNTLRGTKETFSPLSRSSIKMYNCGPTVYDFQHIGNLRPYVLADTIKRVLRFHGYKVEQVINITDVGHLTGDNEGDPSTGEDRMEIGVKRLGKSVSEIVEEVSEAFFSDLDALGIDRSTIRFPRATDYIGEQIALVQTLEEKGYTYKTDDGVYFDTSRFKEYGKLGNINLEGLKEGARIGQVAGRKHPSDFALWKFSRAEDNRLQEWESPWGKGFPGWHIECTAMIFKLLGKQIDIHTGGIDHIPVHHNNEIAQAESITGKPYAKYWMHNAHITIEGKRISKTLRNTIYLHGITDRGFSPIAYRYWLLTGHYRSPLNFTWDALEGADHAYKRLIRYFFEDLPHVSGAVHEPFAKEFIEALSDDLNTPRAIGILWDLVKNDSVSKESKRGSILFADELLGLGLKQRLTEAGRVTVTEELPPEVKEMVAAREVARKERHFNEADSLRDRIANAGYIVTDTDKGPSVRKK